MVNGQRSRLEPAPDLRMMPVSRPAPTRARLSSALEGTKPRIVSYEEQVGTLREQLAELYAEEDDFTKAAQLLSGIDLDSGAA